MKVEYTLYQRGTTRHALGEGKVGKVTFCCDTMRETWTDDCWGIGFEYRAQTVGFIGGEYDCEIGFCPFCAEKIEVVQAASTAACLKGENGRLRLREA